MTLPTHPIRSDRTVIVITSFFFFSRFAFFSAFFSIIFRLLKVGFPLSYMFFFLLKGMTKHLAPSISSIGGDVEIKATLSCSKECYMIFQMHILFHTVSMIVSGKR